LGEEVEAAAGAEEYVAGAAVRDEGSVCENWFVGEGEEGWARVVLRRRFVVLSGVLWCSERQFVEQRQVGQNANKQAVR